MFRLQCRGGPNRERGEIVSLVLKSLLTASTSNDRFAYFPCLFSLQCVLPRESEDHIPTLQSVNIIAPYSVIIVGLAVRPAIAASIRVATLPCCDGAEEAQREVKAIVCRCLFPI